MSIFSTISGYLSDTFRGGSKTVAIHESIEGGKAQTSMSAFAPGLEINPANGENIVITKIKNSKSFVVSIGGTNQNIEPDTERGERKFYSVTEDGAELSASVKLKNNGTIELKSFEGSTEKSSVQLNKDGTINITGNSNINIISDSNITVDASANTTIKAAGTLTLQTGDAVTWQPNILPACLFTGAPHGGSTGGIVKLKGG